MIEASMDVIRQSLNDVEEEIQRFSQVGEANAASIDRLMSMVETAELAGFNVENYRRRLRQLRSICVVLEDKVDRAATFQEQTGELHDMPMKSDGEEKGDPKVFGQGSSDFESMASSPWECCFDQKKIASNPWECLFDAESVGSWPRETEIQGGNEEDDNEVTIEMAIM
ncbi:hypothetical protein COCNU_13G005010 [Cocos nucifera]|uniref:Uncharacterized protein n=1 Tax=Cocos nucifera TaxID=13894 RepID=A0A8K0IT18_COCNU|nr:hypothetical protein COCNU_13G005010 [Cocos nucifera]